MSEALSILPELPIVMGVLLIICVSFGFVLRQVVTALRESQQQFIEAIRASQEQYAVLSTELSKGLHKVVEQLGRLSVAIGAVTRLRSED